MCQKQLPIIGCVRPRNRWPNRWERKRWKKLRLTRSGIFLSSKKQRWILKGLEHRTEQATAWVVGSRNADTAGKLGHKLSPLKECLFDTDDGKGHSKVWPTEWHAIGKNTIFQEQNNSNSRQDFGIMTGRSTIGSRSEEMIFLLKARWQALT